MRRSRSPDERREALQRGFEAEAAVARALEADGWLVLARNWSGGGGELDVVVSRDGALRFVEVKARSPEDDSGIESITEGKQRKLIGAAEAWRLEHPEPIREQCFLIAVVNLGPSGWEIDWFDDAFDGD